MKITLSHTPLDKREPQGEQELEVPQIPKIGDTFFMSCKTEFIVKKIGWFIDDNNGLYVEKIIIQLADPLSPLQSDCN